MLANIAQARSCKLIKEFFRCLQTKSYTANTITIIDNTHHKLFIKNA